VRQQREIIAAVRREKFDIAFNFSAADRALILSGLTGAKRRVNYSGGRPHFWKKWLITDWMEPAAGSNPVFERRRQMLASCGLSLEAPQFGLNPPQGDKTWAEQTVPKNTFHFSVNASTALKDWPVEHWVRLARLIWATRPEIRIVATGRGHPRERARLDAFTAGLKGSTLETFVDLPIPRLTALIQRCALHVGPDSGVLHIATASGIPSVSLFRETAGVAGWLPRGEKHKAFIVKCPCTEQKTTTCLREKDSACLAELSPEKLLEAVLEAK
jgi:ADP-heptose:LPS heptosyltransferase